MANEPAGCLIFGSDFSKLPVVLLVFRGQLGRLMAIDGPVCTKTVGCPLSCSQVCGDTESKRPRTVWGGRAFEDF